MIYTTLAELRKAGACLRGYNKVVRALQGKEFTSADASRFGYIHFAHRENIALVDILKSNGIADAIWALRASPSTERDSRLFAVWCARQVPQSPVGAAALVVAERYANGDATATELAVAYASCAASYADASCAASYASYAAASYAASCDASYDAPYAASYAAASYADAADARTKQSEMFVRMCNGTAPWQTEAV